MNPGVSVHDCQEVATGHWKPLGRSWEFRGGSRSQDSDVPWFLVSGLPMALPGGDGESLIKLVHANFELTWDSHLQVFTNSRVVNIEPAIIHARIDGRCHFPTSDFEGLQEGIYGADFGETDCP